MAEIQRAASASPFEESFGFCRALVAGDRLLVAGTAPIGPDGDTVGVGDPHAQARRCLEIIAAALESLGGRLDQVVRTRMFITNRAAWSEVARAHGEIFGSVRPVATCVIVAGLIDPDWQVEMEAEAWLTP